jgi:hypothetical protein
LAAALAEPLESAPPAEASFEARDHGVLQGYLFRRGRRLDGDSSTSEDATIRAWVFTPDDLADAKHAALADRLAAKHRTLDVPMPGYRVIVR